MCGVMVGLGGKGAVDDGMVEYGDALPLSVFVGEKNEYDDVSGKLFWSDQRHPCVHTLTRKSVTVDKIALSSPAF